jgi:peptidoglycan/LPS O-acetylase OafA/YrhL
VTSNSSVEIAGPSHKHLPALDGVRGLAILLVLVFHLMLFNNNTGNPLWDRVGELRGLGFLGVDLFFVLSGFLITGILYDTLHDPHYFRSFYMRRFLRIFPLYYGFLVLLIILAAVSHVHWDGRQYVLLTYLQNTGIWFPTDGFHPGWLVDVNHFWSLAVEEQFYFAWPLLVFLIKDRRRLIQLALLLSACAFILRTCLSFHTTPFIIGMVHESTLCRMDTLMIGGCLALLLRGERVPFTRRAAAWWFWISMIVMVVFAFTHPRIDLSSAIFIGTVGYSMCAIAFAALIFLSLDPASLWSRVFQARWLRSFGKYSYGMYVLHILVGSLVSIGFNKMLGTSLRIFLTPYLHSRPLAIIVEFCVSVAAVYVAACLSYNLYEVHFLRLKRYFGYRKERSVSASAGHAVAD